jgi:hypothetical protein
MEWNVDVEENEISFRSRVTSATRAPCLTAVSIRHVLGSGYGQCRRRALGPNPDLIPELWREWKTGETENKSKLKVIKA